jgi:hypothetical protein
MSPELTKLLENYNLDNYADLEYLTLADWYTQFEFRESIGKYHLPFSVVIPELLKCPLRPNGGLYAKPDNRLLGVQKLTKKDIQIIAERSAIAEEISLPELPPEEQPIIFEINDVVDDKQIKAEFNRLLKERRKTKDTFSQKKSINHWINFKILQFIDICLIAMSIDNSDDKPFMRSPLFKMKNVSKHITHQEIAFILFKDDIEENLNLIDAQRIKTCKKTVTKVLQPSYLDMLYYRTATMKIPHFIQGMDRLIHKYCDNERIDSYVKGQTEFADKDDRESAYLIAEWTREAFHTAVNRVFGGLDILIEMTKSDKRSKAQLDWLEWLDVFKRLSEDSDIGKLLNQRLSNQLQEMLSNENSSKNITL